MPTDDPSSEGQVARNGLPAAVDNAKRLRALFVEDSAELREMIGLMLEEEGLELVTCSTGEQAEAAFDPAKFDLVFTDVSLPKMNGVELAKRLLAKSPDTWVVFSTGYAMGERLGDIGRHVRALLKPFEEDDLHRLMNEVRANLYP